MRQSVGYVDGMPDLQLYRYQSVAAQEVVGRRFFIVFLGLSLLYHH